jgi:transcriptional regulator with XRE-family HTH domain
MLKTSINGRYLRTLRHLNGDGQLATAKRFRVSQSAISKWECNETGVAHKHLPELREYAIKACRMLLKRVGLRVDVLPAYDRQGSYVTAKDSIDSEE